VGLICAGVRVMSNIISQKISPKINFIVNSGDLLKVKKSTQLKVSLKTLCRVEGINAYYWLMV
jgi:hypothetical protein